MPFRFPFPYPTNYYNTYMNYNNYKNKAISNKPLNTEKASHNRDNNYSKSNSYKDEPKPEEKSKKIILKVIQMRTAFSNYLV